MRSWRAGVLKHESEPFYGAFGLRLVMGLLLATYIVQNFLVRTTQVDSFLVALPVWAVLSLALLFFIRNRYVFFSLIAWLVLVIVYVAASFADPMNGFTQLPFFLANGVLFLMAVITSIGKPEFKSKFVKSSERALDALLFVAILYWMNAVRVEQQYSAEAAYELRANNYLIVADLLVMYSILRMRKRALLGAAIWGGISIFALILLGSRAGMVFGAIAILLRFYVVLPRKILVRVVAVLVAMMAVWVTINAVFEGSSFSRFLSIFDLRGDRSFLQRNDIFDAWVSNIANNVECIVIPCLPQKGMYVHNFISLMEYFGLFGLLIAIVSLAVILRAVSKGWKIPSFALFFFCTAQILIARPFGALVYPIFFAYVVLAFVWLHGRGKEFSREGGSIRRKQISNQAV